ncbi:cytochrome c oxidase accessory protein CcoG [Alphaproteobacteria bacterium GH1-50]|uniref:Cytochrome c oxidase accessory protein CcoG n=1 Tax=Kangsaoukella pontilimi TaxID=2691042 RepID=A0A7C9IT14_9RHOB|nr:cytochrome c oxidase accessory protein CcoG [Kangsaoukella pontilimi]MXQ09206.1 cytochrome c oxidase accessory protein CcoG [Kangsaoukella pontilimi]
MSQEEAPSLYAAREPVFPRRVSGKFRTLKWWIMGITLGIYYLTPWIRWDRGPALPDQAVLVDMANRRFYFFWIEIWPHEFYFVAGLLIMAGLGLFLFTSALGRVWCGYACPQTVWTDLFILVERWIEGDRNARVKLHNAPWNARKWRLRLTKWAAWLVIAVATGGAWVFYFADAPTLLRDLVTLQGHPIAYTTIAVLTLTTFFFGGFAREQICIYACPWPRIQAAMMDEDTITVAYREWRGEPRGKHNLRLQKQREAAEAKIAAERAIGANVAKYAPTPFPGRDLQVGGTPVLSAETEPAPGDCIDCMACVNVCPMGIDIRNGQQLECITCALCIDACDDVMAKIGKPRGLIDYLALTDEVREREGKPPRPIWNHIFRLRTIVYTVLWSLVGLGLVFALFIRAEIDVTVAPIRNPQFVTLSDGSIRNAYDVRLRNKHGETRPFRISVKGDPALRIELEGTVYETADVAANEQLLQRVYVIAPPGSDPATSERTEIRFWVEDLVSGERVHNDSLFNGREPQ